ncbi:MAG TPA: M20/M25/M40 family metallo-hydrolase [Acidimicrobiales bacterium]|nr:M20/M25/M40 family metallo-hydrolase [Acidimicrobiales bacterium]
MSDDRRGEVTDLLQHLIRNACVNDGRSDSGHESRSADVLQTVLSGAGAEVERFTPTAGRDSLVARIEGSDPTAPTLLLMGHTDVVPANPDRWQRDPWGGEVVDDEVWGRGAVDMLNLTASMAVAFRRLAARGWRPRGTLAYLAVADEEALGTWGADWLTTHAADAVRADYVLTESGGVRVPTPSGVRLPVTVGEKGSHWVRLTVRGTAGHGSRPYGTDNAVVNAAEVVRRIAAFHPPADIHAAWRHWVEGIGTEPDVAAALLDPERIEDALPQLPLSAAGYAHACTHTTFAPTVVHGGVKTNVIPDEVTLEVDIRTLPGQTGPDVAALLDEAVGDLRARVEIEVLDDDEATASPLDTPLWDCLERVSGRLVPGSGVVPFLSVGATDSRFFRRVGATCYGYGLFSERIGLGDYQRMFHGHDEHIDIDSLELSTELWEAVATDLLA